MKESRFPKRVPYPRHPDGLDMFEDQMVNYLEGNGYKLDTPEAARVARMYLRGGADDWLVSRLRQTKVDASVPELGSW
jgi:hypothetical protein